MWTYPLCPIVLCLLDWLCHESPSHGGFVCATLCLAQQFALCGYECAIPSYLPTILACHYSSRCVCVFAILMCTAGVSAMCVPDCVMIALVSCVVSGSSLGVTLAVTRGRACNSVSITALFLRVHSVVLNIYYWFRIYWIIIHNTCISQHKSNITTVDINFLWPNFIVYSCKIRCFIKGKSLAAKETTFVYR